jgi:hypothetical protein
MICSNYSDSCTFKHRHTSIRHTILICTSLLTQLLYSLILSGLVIYDILLSSADGSRDNIFAIQLAHIRAKIAPYSTMKLQYQHTIETTNLSNLPCLHTEGKWVSDCVIWTLRSVTLMSERITWNKFNIVYNRSWDSMNVILIVIDAVVLSVKRQSRARRPRGRSSSPDRVKNCHFSI